MVSFRRPPFSPEREVTRAHLRTRAERATGGTGGSGGPGFRNFVIGGDDDDGYGYCAFTQRIEDVSTFASSTDESVTLTFWARGQAGASPNGDIHINLKQCFGSTPPATDREDL